MLVVKVGGARGIPHAPLLDDVARHVAEGGAPVLVHGGSEATTELQAALGRPAEFVTSPSGHVSRRTDRAALEAFAMATALTNRRLVEGLQTRGVGAFGLSGLDGAAVRARRKAAVRTVVDGRVRVLRDEWTGRPEEVDVGLLDALRLRGLVPVLAPLAAGEGGEMLNVDGDRLAARVAAALGATTLVLLTNVPGLLADPEREDTLVPHLDEAELDRADGLARGRMRKKLLGAREALAGGVPRVVLADARRERPLTDALAGRGTVIVAASRERGERGEPGGRGDGAETLERAASAGGLR